MKRLLVLLAAALISTAASAQQNLRPLENGGPNLGNQPLYPQTRTCMTQAGNAVPCALSDIPQPDVAPANTPADASKKALVITASPTSGELPGWPAGSTPLTESNTGTTAAVTATFPAVPGRKNYLCGVSWSPGSAATAITSTLTTAGLASNYTWAVGAPVTAVGTTGTIFSQTFMPCVPASAVNTAITVTGSALSTSGVNNDVNAWGYVQ